MIKTIKSTKGESYFDTVISLLVIMIVVVFAINVFSFLTLKMDMDYFAREMVDVASVYGTIDHISADSEVYSRYNELVADVGINPTCTWEADYFSEIGKKVQYGDTIRLTLTYNTQIGGVGLFDTPITLTTTYSGLSQMYWK